MSFVLAAVTLVVFWRSTQCEFVDYDDSDYVLNNPMVKNGVTPELIKWAFRSGYASNWHPLTWVSHAVDCAIYGLKPWGHHLTNILFHTANTLLLFCLLLEMTRREKIPKSESETTNTAGISREEARAGQPGSLNFWPCALAAGLFGLHPLHVESVAWVAERKDVLSAFFFFLTLLAYAHFVRSGRGQVASEEGLKSEVWILKSRGLWWYGVSLILFAFGLMSKAMLVTTPFVLLLLDFWPLGRFHARSAWIRLAGEKLPFFVMSAVACVATVWAQQQGRAMSNLTTLPVSNRIANAVVSCALYLWKMVWPHPLAVLYPLRDWSAYQVIGAALLLVAISVVTFTQFFRRPYLAVGWLWYLCTLLPVIGLVQVGLQSMADRYTYLPLIGIFIMIAWVARDAVEFVGRYAAAKNATEDALRTAGRQAWLGIAGGVWLAGLALVSYVHIGFWKNSITLFAHTTDVTRDNIRAAYNLGVALGNAGKIDEAIAMYREALAMKPTQVDVQGKAKTVVHHNLGLLYAARGDWSNAENQFREVLRDAPDFAQDRASLAGSLAQQERFDEAIAECQSALNSEPSNAAAWRWFGLSLARRGKNEEAAHALREAVRFSSGGLAEMNELAWFLATDPHDNARNGAEAARLAEKICEATGWQEPLCLATLDAAYAEAGRFPEAISAARRTAETSRRRGDEKLVSEAEARLNLYLQGKPYRQR